MVLNFVDIEILLEFLHQKIISQTSTENPKIHRCLQILYENYLALSISHYYVYFGRLNNGRTFAIVSLRLCRYHRWKTLFFNCLVYVSFLVFLFNYDFDTFNKDLHKRWIPKQRSTILKENRR